MGPRAPQLPPRFGSAKPPGSLLGNVFGFALACLAAPPFAKAVDPLGATPHDDGTTTFRVWAPFVDEVGVNINGGPLSTCLTLSFGPADLQSARR